jgi:hypothetical protein
MKMEQGQKYAMTCLFGAPLFDEYLCCNQNWGGVGKPSLI